MCFCNTCISDWEFKLHLFFPSSPDPLPSPRTLMVYNNMYIAQLVFERQCPVMAGYPSSDALEYSQRSPWHDGGYRLSSAQWTSSLAGWSICHDCVYHVIVHQYTDYTINKREKGREVLAYIPFLSSSDTTHIHNIIIEKILSVSHVLTCPLVPQQPIFRAWHSFFQQCLYNTLYTCLRSCEQGAGVWWAGYLC